MSNPGYIAGTLAYTKSPIILTDGLAKAIGALPIIALTEGANFIANLLSGTNISLDNLFADFKVIEGATMLDNQVGTYPFANQTVAANAYIAEPLYVSMKMICPARNTLGFPLKLATLMALKKTLDQHNQLGGTYTVITPGYVYTQCLLTRITDVSSGESAQVQYEWQMDFIQPLVSLESALAKKSLSGLMNQISSGTKISGTPSWSSLGLAVGNPASLLTSSLVPASVKTAL